MISPAVRRTAGVLLVAALAANTHWAAETPRAKADAGKAGSTAAARPTTARAGVGRGPLPDPALLDGSTLPVEKKSEHGMIGDFELPGDDSKTGKVGGQQGGISIPGLPSAGLPMPSAGGAGMPLPTGLPSLPQAGGAQAPGGQEGPQGGQQGGPQGGQQGGGNPIPGGGDPTAQAQGTQVGELGGDAAGQPPGAAGGPGEKPGNIAIGDKGMRIEPSAAAGAIGGQQQQAAGHTQHHEKGTGSGGKGAGGSGSGNRVEKGRTIPSGL